MVKINQDKYNLSYNPILENYDQFENLPKITSNYSNLQFAHSIEDGKFTIVPHEETDFLYSIQILFETLC